MTTHPQAILMFIAAGLIGAFGQFLYKLGSDKATGGILTYLLNPYLLAGVVCYAAVMVLFIGAFKKGGSLTVLYPIYATTFIWAAVIAWFAYQTPIRPINMLGMVLLIVGMYFMGK